MTTTKFTRNPDGSYFCYTPGDQSGEYVSREEYDKLQHRLDLLGDFPSPTEDTLFGLSAHHTWHHDRENELSTKLEVAELLAKEMGELLTALQQRAEEAERERDGLQAKLAAAEAERSALAFAISYAAEMASVRESIQSYLKAYMKAANEARVDTAEVQGG